MRVASRGLTAFNLGGVAVSISAALLIPHYGSRLTMFAIAVLGTIAALVLIAMPLTPEYTTSLIIVLGITGGAINGVQTILYALAAHVYPTVVRATGVGSASAIGRSGAILSAFAGAWAIEQGGGKAFFLLVGTSMAVTAGALALLRGHVPGRRGLGGVVATSGTYE